MQKNGVKKNRRTHWKFWSLSSIASSSSSCIISLKDMIPEKKKEHENRKKKVIDHAQIQRINLHASPPSSLSR